MYRPAVARVARFSAARIREGRGSSPFVIGTCWFNREHGPPGMLPLTSPSPCSEQAFWPSIRSVSIAYGDGMRDEVLSMGTLIGIGAAIGVLFMPIAGPLALVVGVALGVVAGSAFEASRNTR